MVAHTLYESLGQKFSDKTFAEGGNIVKFAKVSMKVSIYTVNTAVGKPKSLFHLCSV